MTSVVTICNLALSNIGKASIASIEESSAEARQCKLHFALTRDTMLQAYPWLFAQRRQVLAEVANTWDQRWAHAYTRPSDCLKPIRIVPDVDRADDIVDVPYSASEGLIFTGILPARLEYTRRFDDPAKLPPLFQDALAWALASKIALPLTQDTGVRKDAFQIAQQTLGAAQMADANEDHGTWDFPSALIAARG